MDSNLEQSQLLIYQSDNGDIKLDVVMENETVWLTQEQMANLFGKGRSTVTEHIINASSIILCCQELVRVDSLDD